jgi:hypothetical protein
MVIIASNNCGLMFAAVALLCAWTAGLAQCDNTVKTAVELWQQIIVRSSKGPMFNTVSSTCV